jgi:hypothetical protein
MRKIQKGYFHTYKKMSSKFKSNFYTWNRIQQLKLMRIHANPDHKPWFLPGTHLIVYLNGSMAASCLRESVPVTLGHKTRK